MKKTYQTPTATAVELEAQTMLAASGGNTISIDTSDGINSNEDVGGNEFGRTNRQSFWDSYDE